MPKTIRPERLYADHNEKAIVVVYTVQRHDELNNEVSKENERRGDKHTDASIHRSISRSLP